MKKIYLLPILMFFVSWSVTAQTFQSVESAEYDASQNRWLVSNGNNIIARASDGTLSFFGTGGAGYGMEVLGDNLFAIEGDGSTIAGFDLATGNEVMSLAIPGAGFLNGMTNDGVNTLYVTDFGNNRIFKIDVSDLMAPTFEMIVSNTGTTPNGVIYDGANNRLLFTSWQGTNAPIRAVNLSDNAVSTVINTSVGAIDGIDEDNDGNYYISSWSPARITKYDKDFLNPAETITTPAINNPADIGYSKVTDTLAIPIGNNVVFVGFAPDTITAVSNLSADDFGLTVQPNPLSIESTVRFFLPQSEKVELQLFNTQGRLVETLLSGQQPGGAHQVVLAGMKLAEGVYYCRLSTATRQVTRRLVVFK